VEIDRFSPTVLINNAIKHHDRVDGKIEITAEDLGDRDLFSVIDDGPGIPDGESRERIFEIFHTLNPATDSTENTGIGLALVKTIVEAEGREIWLNHQRLTAFYRLSIASTKNLELTVDVD
jgi:signal transduction histidine kinase